MSHDDESHPVGEGPKYEAIREEARKLLPLFMVPGVKTQDHWGAGLIETLEPVEGGHRAAIIHPVCSQWTAQRNSLARVVDLTTIRATGIALLAYAEAQEAAQ